MTTNNQISKNETFKEWVNLYTDYLYQWALKKTSSKEKTEDLVQDTFLAAFNSYEKFENRSNPKTWLISILNHKIIDYYRTKYKQHENINDTFENQNIEIVESYFNKNGQWNSHENNIVWDNDEHLLDNEDFVKIMEICMDDLPEKWRIAINFKYLTDKKSDDICKELNITSTNYWQVIHRAKLLLKKCIELKWDN